MPDMSKLEINGTVYDVRDPTKAPAGYGLGEIAPAVAPKNSDGYYDADLITKSGFWRAKYNTPNVSNWWGILHINYADNYAVQYAYGYYSQSGVMYGTVCRRAKDNGTWFEWEWENPPMSFGVEYRTTERWHSKAVYTQLVSFGALPSASEKIVTIDADGIDRVISAIVTVESAQSGQDVNKKISKIGVYYNSINITTIDGEFADVAAQVLIKYTKD